jgi:hypothetical protein
MRRQIGAYVLQPVGLTNVVSGDATTPSNIANLQNVALYSKAGILPTFAQGATGLLSDAVSNADGTWTAGSYTGETTNATTVGITSASRHYMFGAAISNTELDLSSSNQPFKDTVGSVIVYTCEGPQSKYVPAYLGGSATTSSIKFGTELTGSENNLVFRYFGAGANGDKLQAVNPTTRSPLTKLGGGVASVTFDGTATTSSFAIAKTTIATAGGYALIYSSSANTSITPVTGLCVVISASS